MAKYKKRPDGRYATSTIVGYTDDGKPKRKTLYGRTIMELDKKIPVTLAMSTKPQSVMAQIGERTFQAMKQERAVETCSQLKQGEYTLTCYLFGILPMKEVQVSVVNGKSLYVSGQVVGIYGAAQGVLVLGSGLTSSRSRVWTVSRDHVVD